MTLIDSHCHLDDRRFASDLDAVLERAAAAGVRGMLSIGTGGGPPDLEAAVRMADRYLNVWATVGVHPHHAGKADADAFLRLRDLLRHPKVVAMGEIGLDYHYDFCPRETQRAVFERQLEIAAEAGKPVIIHSREAWDDTVTVLRERWTGAGIFHCFTGGAAQAAEAVGLGFHLAFGGVLTFPNAGDNREAARLAPEDRLLLETDAPYLAPVPHRGKRNEPALMAATAAKLAELRGAPLERIAEVTTANFERLTGIAVCGAS